MERGWRYKEPFYGGKFLATMTQLPSHGSKPQLPHLPRKIEKGTQKAPQTTFLIRQRISWAKHPLQGHLCGQVKDGLGQGECGPSAEVQLFGEQLGEALPHQVYRIKAAPPHRGRRVSHRQGGRRTGGKGGFLTAIHSFPSQLQHGGEVTAEEPARRRAAPAASPRRGQVGPRRGRGLPPST